MRLRNGRPGARHNRRMTWCLAAALAIGACTASGPSSDSSSPGASKVRPDGPPGPQYTPPPIEPVTKPPSSPFRSGCSLPLETLRRIRRGYFPGRSPDVMVVPREPNFFGAFVGQSHSGPWDYVQRVPLVFYGPGFIRSQGSLSLDREVTLADLAPTYAELLDTPSPSDVGAPINEVLVPEANRPGRPKLILTIVWDGGGTNVLDAWPDAWPNLATMMAQGSSIEDVVVGSSPSVTPAVHTTMGTGAFPKQHGVVGIPVRVNGAIKAAYPNKTASNLLLPSLADVYDPATGNQAKIGMLAFKSWHLGMIGHGAYRPRGDKDIAVIVDTQERLVTNRRWYTFPQSLKQVPGLQGDIRSVDLDDGRLDSTWRGHEILRDPVLRRDTPAWTLYQTTLIKALLERERFGEDEIPDLFYTNYKQPDEVGHAWNMLLPEMRPTLRYVDDALGDLTHWLDRVVGRRQWVVALTSDHGQGPLAESSGAWPINMTELIGDAEERFGMAAGELVAESSPVGFWIDQGALESGRISAEGVARWLLGYRLEDNVEPGSEVPAGYRDRVREPILSAAFPSVALGRIWGCAQAR
ncbi:MAG: alkaline phosphatase family protein [Actinobacteria bacterium]|nr:alkaline phosphatase family protein [Actinomycetota bacterium]MDQ3533268.1 alkaline phosphatase family protein [Actinomycetota bacterium]